MRLRSALMIAALAALAASVFAQGPRRDGNWEVKMEMSMPGMTMPAITTTQCITKEDALDPQKALQQAPSGRGGRGGDQNCKVSDYKVEGSKVTYAMTCDGPEKMSGSGEFVYAGETYTGTMTVNVAGRGMTMKYSGKRLGDCTK